MKSEESNKYDKLYVTLLFSQLLLAKGMGMTGSLQLAFHSDSGGMGKFNNICDTAPLSLWLCLTILYA